MEKKKCECLKNERAAREAYLLFSLSEKGLEMQSTDVKVLDQTFSHLTLNTYWTSLSLLYSHSCVSEYRQLGKVSKVKRFPVSVQSFKLFGLLISPALSHLLI
ncbi:hypothetical protein PanWU01x14_061810 [Parasponia andersonii]|uniref:Uncharacterized protein n=1 Tax=Parasponia andersonii TaxID=3476 RepID=A0A2P5DIA8_PARAD|nr:hypothetical protein PanWU01x14_061810 [Parasponia andersonii]